jgi:hypothetical protein
VTAANAASGRQTVARTIGGNVIMGGERATLAFR